MTIAATDDVSRLLEQAAVQQRQGRLDEAEKLCRAVLAREAGSAKAATLLGAVLLKGGQAAEAVEVLERALALAPDQAEIHNNLGIGLRRLGRLGEAISSFSRAAALLPDHAELRYNLANALRQAGRTASAEEEYRRVLTVRPDHAGAATNLGVVLAERGCFDEAAEWHSHARTLRPDDARAHFNLGNARFEQGRPRDAALCFERAIALAPDLPGPHRNLGAILFDQGRIDEAILHSRRAAELAPEDGATLGQSVFQLQTACRWGDWKEAVPKFERAAAAGSAAPYVHLSMSTSAARQKEVAERYSRRFEAALTPPGAPARRADARHAGKLLSDKLRIGYLSGCFHRHPTAYLSVEAFELHDRGRFEVFGYSYGPEDGSAIRRRLRAAFDTFRDLRACSHAEMAARIAEDGIDILVDRQGYTKNSRSRILALRPAPIQVNWLGYPGTMGASFVDYILADRVLVTQGEERFYTEKVVRLPDSYQSNDRRREMAPPPPRETAGLPARGVVLACFNQAYKILPDMFAAWMRVLAAVPESVLWLWERHPVASDNLRREAEARGIAGSRLVFAPTAPQAEHLSRYALADLALDTYPYTSHATASDALWAGCPLLTMAGETFASRVAASLLHAAGLPELVTRDLASFERKAAELANARPSLDALRARLVAGRSQLPLFDTPRFVANLENAYRGMWERHVAGEPPGHIDVEPELAESPSSRYRREAGERPGSWRAHYNLGVALAEQGKAGEAIESYRRALALEPSAKAHVNLGTLLKAQGRLEEAADNYIAALALDPRAILARGNLGSLRAEQGRAAEAIACYREVLELEPGHLDAACNLAHVLRAEGKLAEADERYRDILSRSPDHVRALCGLGVLAIFEGAATEAAGLFRRALDRDGACAEALHGLGVAMLHLGKLDEAATALRNAIERNPRLAGAHADLAYALLGQRDLIAAVECYRKAAELDPTRMSSLDQLVHQLQELCDWDGWKATVPHLEARLSAPDAFANPYVLLAMPGSAARQRENAERFARQYAPLASRAPSIAERRPPRGDRTKLRVGYLSGYFHRHATSYLTVEAFELHDRGAFEIYGYSYGPDDGSEIRRRIRDACDVFRDQRAASLVDMAAQIAADGIDILVDRKGYTKESRSQVLALRPAPIQVNWLGYPGTLGAPWVDYIVADGVIVPDGADAFYTEKVMRLPETYQSNDRHRAIGPVPSRAQAGLPEDATVLCCFNQAYKILPDMFDAWMRILRGVPGSVLWLFEKYPEASANLRREAEARGVDPARLVFARYAPLSDHLARYRLADLALDTFPYTSHTTASDALWAACPLLTLRGETFASRVAASLLGAAGLPDLVTGDLEAFVARAIELGTRPEQRSALRAQLEASRETCPLFDTPRFVRHLESAYRAMWDLHSAGRPPAALTIEAQARGPAPAAPARPPRAEPADAQALARARQYNNLAVELRKQGKVEESIAACRRAIALAPDYAKAYNNLGSALSDRGEVADAIAAFEKAIAIDPASPIAHNNLGKALMDDGRRAAAQASYRHALALKPDYSKAHYNLANSLHAEGAMAVIENLGAGEGGGPAHDQAAASRLESAIEHYRQAVEIEPAFAQAHANLGGALREQGRLTDASAHLRRALELMPDNIRIHCNLAMVLQQEGRLEEAIERYLKALQLDPGDVPALAGMAAALVANGDAKAAIPRYERALELRPGDATLLFQRGFALRSAGRLAEGAASYRQGFALDPRNAYHYGYYVHLLQHLCDWPAWEREWEVLRGMLGESRQIVSPFATLAVPATPEQRLVLAQAVARQYKLASPAPLPARPLRAGEGRIRIGYYSADFYSHATAALISELFELHDRAGFEIIAYSYGPYDTGRYRRRISKSVDRFVEMRQASYRANAERIHADEVDILVDLKGYTKDSRSRILAMRPAPIQVNWLGFPGTLGGDLADYIIADRFIVPPRQERFYSEKIVRLPHCYQPNDRQRRIAATPTRAACGLPDNGFVFASFNQIYKVLPETFSSWMRILAAIPDSVLWILEKDAEASANLRREAEARGISASRLHFAPWIHMAEHLARYRVADLALDTFPYTAHTTASDALWAGCPLVTRVGDTFASRVAGSLLHAAGLPELATASLEEYERLAIRLALDRPALAALRERLEQGRERCPLFDTPRFARDIERAFALMWERHLAGLPPEHLDLGEA